MKLDKIRAWCRGKMNRDTMMILALSGILIMILAIPAGGREEKKEAVQSGLSDGKKDTLITETDTEETVWEADLERRLEAFLSRMDGVGQAVVLLTFSSSQESVVEKDTPYSQSRTQEQDASGTAREIASRQQEEDTVYTTDGEGRQVPYVRKTLAARVEGVTVLAQGGGDAAVQAQITDVMMVLFGIGPHKIKVAKLSGVSG